MKRRTLTLTRDELWVALASAALFAVAFPPFPLVVPAFLCLAPLAATVARNTDVNRSWRTSARLGFWFGMAGFAVNLYWIAVALQLYTKLAFLGYVATVFGMGLILGGVVAALHAARAATRAPMAVLLPTIWVSFEVGMNYLSDLAFPWLPMGLALSRHPLLAQAADLTGVRGLSFWIAATNGLLADAWLLRASRPAAGRRVAGAILGALAVTAYGAWRMRATVLRPLGTVGVVQPNIPQEEKWQEENRDRIVGILASLTRQQLARGDAELVVWPEVALPGFIEAYDLFLDHPEWADTLAALTTAGSVPIVFGVLDVEVRSRDDYSYYNAAMLADSAGRLGTQPDYHKTYLVPIVERVPFLDPRWFSTLRYFGGYSRGGRPSVFRLPFGEAGVLICYESIFPQRSRLYRRDGADVLLIITNDAWFGRTIAPYQHEAHAALRAIENRVGVVRAANTGISEYVDPLGRVHAATALYTREERTYDVQTSDVDSLYVRFGDWLGTLSVAGTAALLILAWRARSSARA